MSPTGPPHGPWGNSAGSLPAHCTPRAREWDPEQDLSGDPPL